MEISQKEKIMAETVQHLVRPEGRVAYEIDGDGPLVLCVPGMGDLRPAYRFLAEDLRAAGYRVAVMDLRGHGDSDATFSSYDDEATASDIVALAEHLGGPVTVVGNSMAAGSAVIAAAERPDLVQRLVLSGPFVRNPQFGAVKGALMTGVMRTMLLRPWGKLAWRAYFGSLYPGRKPEGFAAHSAAIDASFRRPEYWKAFVATTHTTHAPAEQRLDAVRAATLVVMGEKDPDFADPAAEAGFIALKLEAQVVMVPLAGHYPHAEYRELVSPAVVAFLAGSKAGPVA